MIENLDIQKISSFVPLKGVYDSKFWYYDGGESFIGEITLPSTFFINNENVNVSDRTENMVDSQDEEITDRLDSIYNNEHEGYSLFGKYYNSRTEIRGIFYGTNFQANGQFIIKRDKDTPMEDISVKMITKKGETFFTKFTIQDKNMEIVGVAKKDDDVNLVTIEEEENGLGETEKTKPELDLLDIIDDSEFSWEAI